MRQDQSDPIGLIATNRSEILHRPFKCRLVSIREILGNVGDFESVASQLCLVDPVEADVQDVIDAAIRLRNAGCTVIVSNPDEVPLDLVQDIAAFIQRCRQDGQPIRDEVILTEKAMTTLGDLASQLEPLEE